MSHLIRSATNPEGPIAAPARGLSKVSFFQLVRLGSGESRSISAAGCETLCVVLSGRVTIVVGPDIFKDVGRRANIWEGPADSVYCGTGRPVTITAQSGGVEVAIAGGICAGEHTPFRITPEEVTMVEVGSAATHSRRRIFHILGQNANGRAGNLLVSELYADGGCWSGYPSHKHDTERPPEETNFEEIYHYRFNPESGFGGQFLYEEQVPGAPEPKVVMTRNGDTFIVDKGYHPTVASPGHDGYIFTILVGLHQRSLIQSFEPQHRHLMDKIPGIQAMRDKFK